MKGRRRVELNPTASAGFWIGVYLFLVAAPLLVLACGPRPAGRGFLVDLSIGLGFAGIAMMAVQFALTARFRRATAPYGIDVIYYFHRYLSVVAFAAIVAHPALLVLDDWSYTVFLDPRIAPRHMQAGLWSVLALCAVLLTSFARRLLRVEYDAWRILHLVLAIAAVVLAFVHVDGVGYYVAAGWMGVAWPALVGLWLSVLLWVRLVRPWLVLESPYHLVGVTRERGDAWTLALEPYGHRGFSFEPGQFVWLSVGNSPFAMKDHPFSISSSPLESPRLELTVKALGDFTRTIKDVRAGEPAWVDGPYGAFSVDRYDPPGFVFIAGGIGIAPIMSMARTLAARGETRPVTLFYAYRLWERMTFREELDALALRMPLRIVHVLDEPGPGWRGERGRVTLDVLDRNLPAERKHLEYFVCGPDPMIRSVERSLHALGIPMARCHSELFDLV